MIMMHMAQEPFSHVVHQMFVVSKYLALDKMFFSHFSTKPVVGTHYKHLSEVLLMSIHVFIEK